MSMKFNPFRAIDDWFSYPHRLLAVRASIAKEQTAVLDVGCGNHSPSLTRRYFPDVVYHGICKGNWNLDDADYRAMDKYFDIDLEQPEHCAIIEDNAYDAIICSHILEHLSDPYAILQVLCRKLKTGGVMYIEVPSARSLNFPRVAETRKFIKGCLNFFDDPTHRTFVDLRKIQGLFNGTEYRMSPVKRRFLWRRVLFLPLYAIAGLILRRYIPTSTLWDITGFAEYILISRLSVSSR
jgi:2-polyprenyl-3-methyl-5-hydroxy-6-metoxy-1,4-benzoquinol methylase